MNIFNRISKSFINIFKPSKTQKTQKTQQDSQKTQKTQKTQQDSQKTMSDSGKRKKTQKTSLFNSFKNLFKKEVKKEVKKETYKIQNKAKKPQWDLISDMSVLVKLKTNKGDQYRYWGIYADGEKISDQFIKKTIENEIYLGAYGVESINTTSGMSFEIESFQIIEAYEGVY